MKPAFILLLNSAEMESGKDFVCILSFPAEKPLSS
jgi:hypothetical protein